MKYAIVYRKLLFWEWTLFGIKVSEPRLGEINIPLPKGIRFPKVKTPTPEESSMVEEMMMTPGYKVVKRFWNREAIILAIGCIAEKERVQEKQGEYMGFVHAQIIIHKIVNRGTEVEGEDEETVGDVYEGMRLYDQRAVDEYY